MIVVWVLFLIGNVAFFIQGQYWYSGLSALFCLWMLYVTWMDA